MEKFANILITGASSGIGEALALYYAAHGAKNLFLSGRNLERLSSVKERCQKFGVHTDIRQIDVTNRQEMEAWLQECQQKAPLDIVFANAGISTGEETMVNIYNTFETNIMGVLNTILPTIEIFRNTAHGAKTLVITSSIAGYHGLAACPSYSATKACVKAYGEALRNQLKPEGIQVNVICPGFVKSRITDKNTCPMPFFMNAEKAAEIIAQRVEKNIGLITFPWPMRFAAWLISILPNCISDYIYASLPHKV